MDLGKAFSFPFDDEQWVTSILLGGLIFLIPVVGQIALIGYMLETARNVAMGSPRPLPKWDSFGEKLRLGFGAFVISLAYALPSILIAILVACASVGLGAAGGEDSAGAVVLVTFCAMPIIFILALVSAPLILVGWVRYLQTGSIGAGLQFAEVIATVRQDLGGWLVLWLLSILCSLVASVGSIVVIGFIFTYPYSQAVMGHLLGQKLQSLGRAGGLDYAPPAPPVSF